MAKPDYQWRIAILVYGLHNSKYKEDADLMCAMLLLRGMLAYTRGPGLAPARLGFATSATHVLMLGVWQSKRCVMHCRRGVEGSLGLS